MKNTKIISILFVAAILLISTQSFGRYDHFNSIYNKYKGQSGFISLSFSGSTLGSFLKDDKDQDVRKFLNSLNEIKLLIYGDGNAASTAQYRTELKDCFKSEKYEDMMVVNDGGDKVEIKAVSQNGKISEMVLLITDKTSIVVIYLDGNIDMANAQKLAKHISKNGMNVTM